MTAGLEPYPRPPGRPPGQAARRTSLGSLILVAVGVAMAVGWVAVGLAARADIPHAEEYPDPVGSGLEQMVDWAGLGCALLGTALAAGAAVAGAYGRHLIAVGLLAVSGLSPLIVGVGLLVWLAVAASA